MSDRVLARSVFALLLILPVWAIAQTTLTNETSNNTSACAAAGSPSYCQAGFYGMSDSTSGMYDPPPGNVSDVDTHTLLYPGNSTLVVAHMQGWFCMNSGSTVTGAGTKCGSHIQVGYTSYDAGTVDGQISDMVRRGINAVVLDWYGTKISPNPHELTAEALRTNLDARCQNDPNCTLMALMEDEGAFKWTDCPKNGNGVDQTSCLTAALERDLQYMNDNYYGHPSYVRVDTSGVRSSTGRPIVLFFICEECWYNPTPNWTQVWNDVRAYANGMTYSPYFIFRNAGGFTHPQTSGSFAWVNWGSSDPYGLAYLDNFYDTAVAHPSLFPMGGSWKGFDETNAPWVTSNPRIMLQQCGLTWLQTFNQLAHNNDYVGNRLLPFFGIVTWNDYEEGTEVETGIDNCLTMSASVSGSVLSWTPKFSSGGSEQTVHNYIVFDSLDGQNLTAIATPSPGTYSIDLSTFTLAQGTHTVYVKAVGQPSILNHMSNGVAYYVGVPAPITVSALTVSPGSVWGGNSAKGTVTLSAPAPAGGAVIALATNNVAASVPNTITMAAGVTSGTFPISTTVVTTTTAVTITASYNASSVSAVLNVKTKKR